MPGPLQSGQVKYIAIIDTKLPSSDTEHIVGKLQDTLGRVIPVGVGGRSLPMSARFSAASLLMLPGSMFSILLRSTSGACDLTDLSASARTLNLQFLTKRAGLMASAVHRLTDDRGAARLRDRLIVFAMVVCILVAIFDLLYELM